MRSHRHVVWVVIIVALVLVLSGVGLWVIHVVTSPIKGEGDAYINKNSAKNWVKAQAQFEQDYADIKATDTKIVNAYELWQQNQADKTAQQTYTGLQSYCLSLVADYNSAARSYLSEDFRSSDLPAEIKTDGTNADPSTDCKE